MKGQYGWMDALEILQAMKEGEDAQETRIERCERLVDSSAHLPKTPSPSIESVPSSSAQWKRDAQEWEKTHHTSFPSSSITRHQWDFELQQWTTSSQDTDSKLHKSTAGPMREIWMQLHRSLRALPRSGISDQTSQNVPTQINSSDSLDSTTNEHSLASNSTSSSS